MKVLVTGGAGFVGSHACKLLASEGYELVVLDNFSTGFKENVRWSSYVDCDLLHLDSVISVVADFKPDAIMHFAAKAYVGESVSNPIKYFQNNVVGSINLLKAMEISNIKKIIFSSTCATYGSPNVELISETDFQNPINPYGQSKLMVENILRYVAATSDLKYIGLRYFNAAGVEDSGVLLEKHNPETHLIPLAVKSCFEDYELKVFGNDYPTFDGSAVRDYVHVEDLAQAHLFALRYLENGGSSQFLNLGTGQGVSVFEVISALTKLGLNPKFKVTERRPGDPPFLVADSSKAQKVLNWIPSKSEISEIVKSVISATSN
jgi:UDP-glucose 4-epimerase